MYFTNGYFYKLSTVSFLELLNRYFKNMDLIDDGFVYYTVPFLELLDR